MLDFCNVLGSGQESQDLLNDVEKIIKKYSNDQLNDVLLPTTVTVPKGRPKNTKRNKLSIEIEVEKINEERKAENKRSRADKNEEVIKILSSQKQKKSVSKIPSPPKSIIKDIEAK
jgi:hypothetical protein